MIFDVDALLNSLPTMGWGMLGIFMVIGIIMLIIWILGKIFPVKKEDNKDKN
ncbi:MAG: hypothetical protein IJL30_04225 [Clostridia bacterium]|nr:hypothetical protein [Clostridia bacterium]